MLYIHQIFQLLLMTTGEWIAVIGPLIGHLSNPWLVSRYTRKQKFLIQLILTNQATRPGATNISRVDCGVFVVAAE